jgi:hypothetical protein
VSDAGSNVRSEQNDPGSEELHGVRFRPVLFGVWVSPWSVLLASDMRRDFGPLAGGLRAAFAPGHPRFERPFICAPRPPLLAALRLIFVAMLIIVPSR